MKKLSIVLGITLALALAGSPASASEIWMDIGAPGHPLDGVADDPCELTIMLSDNVQIDLYLDWTEIFNLKSLDYRFTWGAGMSLVSTDSTAAFAYGWDAEGVNPDTSYIAFGLAEQQSGIPGPDSSIPLHSVTMHCDELGDTTITISTVLAIDMDTEEYPLDDVSCLFHQAEPQCTCDLAPGAVELAPDDTQQYTATPHATNCFVQDPTYLWADNCNCGDVDQNGLFTAGSFSAYETCKVSATDQTNTTTDPPIICEADVTCMPATSCASKIYKGGVCEESSPLDTIYNRPGRRGLSITCCEEEEFCICSSCDEREHCWVVTKIDGDPDFDVAVDLVADSGTGDQFTLKVAAPCTTHCPMLPVILQVSIEDCAVSGVSLDSVIVQIGRVALGMGDTNAHPGSQTADVEVLLWNYENHVKAIQADICGTEMEGCNAYDTVDLCSDVECAKITEETPCGDAADCQWKTVGGVPQCVNLLNCAWVVGLGCVAQDNVVCTECVVDEDRSAEFVCSANERANGCCRVTLYTTEPDDLIQQGDGAVAIVKYDVGEEKTSKDCIELIPTGIKISDQFNEFLCAVPKAGEICFMICGDVYPQDCYECESCGDGVVDLFDILEEIDIALGIQTASLCQMLHGDVPLGMPPYCGDPAGVTPPNCDTDDIIDIFDALVIIDKALSRMNCCDYCMYGEIY